MICRSKNKGGMGVLRIWGNIIYVYYVNSSGIWRLCLVYGRILLKLNIF
jgi:hypothetical protein